MRVTLLIDVETEDLPRLQKYVGEQPAVLLKFEDSHHFWGRFIGAKEAIHGLEGIVENRGD